MERSLPCNNTCRNIKRFGSLMDMAKKKPAYFPATLLRFAKNHYPYLVKLESKIENMIKEGKDSIEMPFIND